MLTDFHFLRPYWFIAVIPFAFLLWRMAKQHLVNKHWESVCDPALLPYILVGKPGRKHYMGLVLMGLVMFMMILALAGPTWERLPQPVFQKESALVIALDLSLSMYADDIQPSRLERARFKISDLLDARKEGQTALLVYAGDAFTVTPLTDDIKTIKSQLSALSPEIMPAPGSNTDKALEKAVGLLKQAGISKGHILLITDEVDTDFESSFSESATQGYKVSIMGIGTEEGAPIKINDGSFLKDSSGTIVIPKLNPIALRHLASIGGGHYETSQIDDADINRFNQLFTSRVDASEESKTDLKTDRWYEFGPWLVLLILPIAALGFRRGYLSVLICLFLINPDDAMAFDWDSLWLNNNQRAMRELNNEQAQAASELFKDNEWKAAAKYRAGDYAATEELLKEADNERSLYNKANALAKQGRFEEAIAAYDNVLEKNPKNEDAKFNKELIEKELEKQKNQQQNQNQQQQSDSNQQSKENQEKNPKSENQQKSDSSQNDEQQSGQKQQQADSDSRQGKDQKSQEDTKQPEEQSSESGSQNSTRQQQPEMNDEQQKQTEQQKMDSSQDSSDEQPEQEQAAQQSTQELDEEQQASEQWLRRIPDDPSGLLRRKFKYQYQQQNKQQSENGKYW